MINKTHVSDVCAKIKSKLNVSGILVTFKEFKANERYHRRPSCLYFKQIFGKEIKHLSAKIYYPLYHKGNNDLIFVCQTELDYNFVLQVCDYTILGEIFNQPLLVKTFFHSTED